jgi:hypothetical protein
MSKDFEIPKYKTQITNKFQIPTSNNQNSTPDIWSLKFDYWNLFGICHL